MSITHQIVISLTSNSRASVTGTGNTVGGNEIAIDVTIPASQTNLLFAISFLVAGLQSFLLVASTNLTIKTNSSTTPGNTINLTAGIPLCWYAGCGFANPFTVDVTAWYLTNSTSATNLQGRILST